MSADQWDFLFRAVQAASVLFAVTFGSVQIRYLRRQRSFDALERMFREWEKGQAHRRALARNFPVLGGSVEEKCMKLAEEVLECVDKSGNPPPWWTHARRLVHQLNDMGALLERGAVAPRDFYGQFHMRVIELTHLLRPLILVVSASRGSRWGVRLLRMQEAAITYHHNTAVHSSREIEIHGEVVVPARTAGESTIPLRLHSKRLLPSKEKTQVADERAISSAVDALDSADLDRSLLREVLR
jgi:hypothetical protein